jgi:hypothetical protein
MDALHEIREELRQIRELLTSPDARFDDLVDCHYIASRTGLSPRTVRDGKAGTNRIPRALLNENGKRSPVRFRRVDADRFIREILIDQPAKERALRLLHRRSKPSRRNAA